MHIIFTNAMKSPKLLHRLSEKNRVILRGKSFASFRLSVNIDTKITENAKNENKTNGIWMLNENRKWKLLEIHRSKQKWSESPIQSYFVKH